MLHAHLVARPFRLVAAAVLAGSGTAVVTPPAQAAEVRPDPKLLATAVAANGAPAAVVARRTADGTTAAAAGTAELRTRRPARPRDRYRIGSNTKPMVATVVLQLVAEGRIRLDDPVAPTLPELGLDRRITVRHLLGQTSGLPTDTMLWREPDAYTKNRFRVFSPAELVRIALTHPDPRPTPGTAWRYSNTNYVIAGMLVERLTGEQLGAELDRRVFRPLGMRDTYLPAAADSTVRGPHLHGYLAEGPLTDTTRYGMSWAWAAGALVSTAADQTTFMRGLFGGRLLPARLLAEMTTPGPQKNYGLGLVRLAVQCVPGGYAWGHDGAVFGYMSWMLSTPDGSRQSSAVGTVWADPLSTIDAVVARAAGDALCDRPADTPAPATAVPQSPALVPAGSNVSSSLSSTYR